MVLIHDIVEIDVGDIFLCADDTNEEKYQKELAAAKRIFSMLPEKQNKELFDL